MLDILIKDRDVSTIIPKNFKQLNRRKEISSVVEILRDINDYLLRKEFVDFDLSDYVDIFNDPSKQYGKHYMIDMTANIYDGDNVHFANVEIDNPSKTCDIRPGANSIERGSCKLITSSFNFTFIVFSKH